ncbi:MAG: hypothetical protein L6R42_001378 [Xanthoria sp. 1 TBL-2021]|nr:MAG: hypothetical protein L6R42_001378 [Xanthoria sp. 1 TBL-2021]
MFIVFPLLQLPGKVRLTQIRYNSAVFGVTTGQDYNIHFINASDVSTVEFLASTKRNLTNGKWQSLYDTQYVSNAGDLHLIIDKFGLGLKLDSNLSSPSWSYLPTSGLEGLTDTFIPGPIWPDSGTISTNMVLSPKDNTYSIKQPSSILTFNISAHNGSYMPDVTWPDPVFISSSISHTWKAGVSIDDQGWLSTASLSNRTSGATTLHTSYGLSTHIPQSSSIQVARMFLVVVMVCNVLKTIAIYFTLRESLSSQILTLGDAVSSYLEPPDLGTMGACILSRRKLARNSSHGEKHGPAQWQHRRVHYLFGVTGNGWITYSVL